MTIKYKDAADILKFRKRHWWLKHTAVWKLSRTDEYNYKLTCDIAWWFYILAYIPANLINVFIAMWDYGLKEFELTKRHFRTYNIHKTDGSFIRAELIYERYSNDRK